MDNQGKEIQLKQENQLSTQGNKELATTQSMMPAEMIRVAIENKADLVQVEKMMELQFRWEANEAKKVFNKHLVEVHKEMPVVGKSLKNAQTNSKYASLDAIILKTKAVYTSHGFSITFYEGDTTKPDHIRICADVVHSAGHKETYFYDVPMDGKGIKGNVNMTPIHAKASSTSYAHRYLMCMIWNIPTGDDNDAQTACVDYIDDKELSILTDLIDNNNKDIKKVLAWLKVDALERLPKNQYNKAFVALGGKK